MKIALVIWQLDTYGGSIRQCLELARALRRAGHTAEIFAYSVDRRRCFPEFIDEVVIRTPFPLPLKQWLYGPTDWLPIRVVAFFYNLMLQRLQARLLASLLQKYHRQESYDVINFHDNGVIQMADRFLGTKRVWMMNDPPSFIDTIEKEASVHSRSSLLRFLVWAQTLETEKMLASIDVIAVLDERNRQIVGRYFGKSAKIVRSGLLIPPPLRTLQAKKKKRNVVVLTTNIFFRHRRYEDLVLAAAKLINVRGTRNVEFHIVGDNAPDPAYYKEIRRLVSEHGLSKYFSFLGKVSEQSLEKEYRNADIFVFANHNQTWGLSVFEALLRGCAVIVSLTSGAHDVLRHGVNALFIEPKNPTDLADKLQRLILDSRLRKQIARRGHGFVTENISWENYATSMMGLFTAPPAGKYSSRTI